MDIKIWIGLLLLLVNACNARDIRNASCWRVQDKKASLPSTHFFARRPKKLEHCQNLCSNIKHCKFVFFDHGLNLCYLNEVQVQPRTIKLSPGNFTIYFYSC